VGESILPHSPLPFNPYHFPRTILNVDLDIISTPARQSRRGKSVLPYATGLRNAGGEMGRKKEEGREKRRGKGENDYGYYF